MYTLFSKVRNVEFLGEYENLFFDSCVEVYCGYSYIWHALYVLLMHNVRSNKKLKAYRPNVHIYLQFILKL